MVKYHMPLSSILEKSCLRPCEGSLCSWYGGNLNPRKNALLMLFEEDASAAFPMGPSVPNDMILFLFPR